MGNENVTNIHNGILLKCKEQWINGFCRQIRKNPGWGQPTPKR